MIYYENGNLRVKGNFKDGKENGLWEWYSENGKLEKKGNYKEGLQEDGLWEFYHKNGQLLEKEISNTEKRWCLGILL